MPDLKLDFILGTQGAGNGEAKTPADNPFSKIKVGQGTSTPEAPADNPFSKIKLKNKSLQAEMEAYGHPEKKSLGQTLTENLPTAGAIAASFLPGVPELGMLGRAGAAALGSIPGTAAKQEIEQRLGYSPTPSAVESFLGTSPSTPEGTAAGIAGNALEQGAQQFLGEAFFKGLGSLLDRTLPKSAQPLATSATSGSSTPSIQATSPTPLSALPAAKDYQQATLAHLSAQEDEQIAKEAVTNVYKTIDQALGAVQNPAATGTGTQSGLKAASDIWHREGTALYDKARELGANIPVSTTNISAEASRLLEERRSALTAGMTEEQLQQAGGKRDVFDYTPGTKSVLERLVRLPEEVPMATLDVVLKELRNIGPEAGELAADQAQGVAKHFMSLASQAMEKAYTSAGDTAAAGAAKQARVFWKEGAQLFDHAILSKAMKVTPESVADLITPGSPRSAPGITEASRIRDGILGYVEKYGTADEKKQAAATYQQFLSDFTRRKLLTDNIATLPKQLKAFGPDVINTLFDANAQSKVIKTNLSDLSSSIDLANRRAGATVDAAKAAEEARKSYLAAVKEAGVETKETAKAAQKVADDKAKLVAQTQKERQDKIRSVLRIMLSSAGAALGFELSGNNIGGAIGISAGAGADALMPYVLRSKAATNYIRTGFISGIEKGTKIPGATTIASGMNVAPNITPAWLINLVKGFKIAQDVQKSMEQSTVTPPTRTPGRVITPLTPLPSPRGGTFPK